MRTIVKQLTLHRLKLEAQVFRLEIWKKKEKVRKKAPSEETLQEEQERTELIF